jgi:hypothetical protein
LHSNFFKFIKGMFDLQFDQKEREKNNIYLWKM